MKKVAADSMTCLNCAHLEDPNDHSYKYHRCQCTKIPKCITRWSLKRTTHFVNIRDPFLDCPAWEAAKEEE